MLRHSKTIINSKLEKKILRLENVNLRLKTKESQKQDQSFERGSLTKKEKKKLHRQENINIIFETEEIQKQDSIFT